MTTNAGRATIVGGLPPDVTITVYEHGTTTVANLYTDGSNGVAAPNPVAADAFGDLTFFAAPGTYDLVFDQSDVQRTVTVCTSPNPSLSWPG